MSERPDGVDQRDPGLDEDQRAEVRVAAADRRRGVHHRRDAGLDEPLGGDAVEVLVVDHGDVAGLDPAARRSFVRRSTRAVPAPAGGRGGTSGPEQTLGAPSGLASHPSPVRAVRRIRPASRAAPAA